MRWKRFWVEVRRSVLLQNMTKIVSPKQGTLEEVQSIADAKRSQGTPVRWEAQSEARSFQAGCHHCWQDHKYEVDPVAEQQTTWRAASLISFRTWNVKSYNASKYLSPLFEPNYRMAGNFGRELNFISGLSCKCQTKIYQFSLLADIIRMAIPYQLYQYSCNNNFEPNRFLPIFPALQ